MQRRSFMKLVGGGVVVAAAGVGANAMRLPKAALAPWGAAGLGYSDARLNALSYAILAPNPHNRQPWMVELVDENSLRLFVDTDRMLPHTDPFNRQITIGLGCFLELLRMAAAEDGLNTEITTFPDGEDVAGLDGRPVAQVTFSTGATSDPLFAFHQQRRSLKEPFDLDRAVSQRDLDQIISAGRGNAGGSVDPDSITYWRDMTVAALEIETDTPHTFKESVDLFRIGASEINANPDGIDFSGPLFQTLGTFGLMTREATLNTQSTVFAQGLAAVLENAATAMGHVWLVTDSNARGDQIAAGADWLRINLAATSLGIGFQPLSQALQEYPEMQALYAQTHDVLAPGGGTVQMLARIGYGPDVPPSPRWGLEAKLLG